MFKKSFSLVLSGLVFWGCGSRATQNSAESRALSAGGASSYTAAFVPVNLAGGRSAFALQVCESGRQASAGKQGACEFPLLAQNGEPLLLSAAPLSQGCRLPTAQSRRVAMGTWTTSSSVASALKMQGDNAVRKDDDSVLKGGRYDNSMAGDLLAIPAVMLGMCVVGGFVAAVDAGYLNEAAAAVLAVTTVVGGYALFVYSAVRSMGKSELREFDHKIDDGSVTKGASSIQSGAVLNLSFSRNNPFLTKEQAKGLVSDLAQLLKVRIHSRILL